MLKFQNDFTLEERTKEAKKMRSIYPDKIPIFIESRGNIPQVDQYKYLIPEDFTVSQLLCFIRNKFTLTPEIGIYLLVDNKIPSSNQLMSQVDQQYRSADFFLYVCVCGENTFG